MAAPKKYVKINGVMKMNPEYKRWKEAQSGGQTPGTTVPRPSQALPIISSMDDHEELNEIVVAGGGKEIPLAESTNATIESKSTSISLPLSIRILCLFFSLFFFLFLFVWTFIYFVMMSETTNNNN